MDRVSGRGMVNLGALLALALAVPAQADVRAGVDAWSRGDYAAAVREWVGPAANGDPDAQYNLAQAYRLGRGVDADPKQAQALYQRAAAQGHVKAADNYGLLLFQSGEREKAMPYIEGAAGRGDPRAQYILGIAHFNGDLATKDWPRAYALLTLANATGLPQARGAIQQMDEYIPLAERQAAQTLAAKLKAETDAARARDMAEVDLALGTEGVSGGGRPAVAAASPQPAPVTVSRGSASPALAGADFTLPAKAQPAPAAPVVIARAEPDAPVAARPAPPKPAPRVATAATGPWKIQLGAFGVAGNADKLWSQLAGRSELAGKTKLKVASGSLTRLLAGGFASKAQADAACGALKRSGQSCLVTQ